MRKQVQILLFLTITLIGSCGSQKNAVIPEPGNWELIFDVGETKIPARLKISEAGRWQIINSTEVITIDSVQWSGSNFHVKLPLFHSVLDGKILSGKHITGTWSDNSRDSVYRVPFEASLKSVENPANRTGDTKSITYNAFFSPENPSERTHAVGLLTYSDHKVEGTFMTESGDFRFLEGERRGNDLYLSCFDGSHLFYFTATQSGDSLVNGIFYSGKHWKEPWIANVDTMASLRNPDSLTVNKNSSGHLRFSAKSASGDSVTLDSEDFQGKVTLVQIFGSWCPNCTDESIFLKSLYQKYGDRGLQIIPVAFERINDFEKNKEIISRQFEQLSLPYNWYLGGVRSDASRVFADLSKISSFPTTIFIDKSGKTRKIHTGFYGPGTGKYYTHHTEILDMFVQQLLIE